MLRSNPYVFIIVVRHVCDNASLLLVVSFFLSIHNINIETYCERLCIFKL